MPLKCNILLHDIIRDDMLLSLKGHLSEVSFVLKMDSNETLAYVLSFLKSLLKTIGCAYETFF